MTTPLMAAELDESSLTSALDNPSRLSSSMDSPDVPLSIGISPHSMASPMSSSANTTVFIQPSTSFSPGNDATGIYVEDNCNPLDVKSNHSEEDMASSHFLSRLTPTSPPGILLSGMTSNDLPESPGAFGLSPDPESPPDPLLITPSPKESVEFLPDGEIPLIAPSPPSFQEVVTPRTNPTSSTSRCQPPMADSYASLTSWTTKLITHGVGQLPSPDPENMPIPMYGISYQFSVPASSTPLYSKPDLSSGSSLPVYSKIGPIPSRPTLSGSTNSVNPSAVPSPIVKISSMHKPKFKPSPNKEHRFKKTADALQKSGLWEVAMKTGNLIKRNRELQKELEQFRADALLFLKSVIKNPQNKHFIKTVLNNAILASNSGQKKSVMSAVVTAAAAASLKAKSVSSMHDSGVSSSGGCGSQSDQSVSNFSCSGNPPETNSPGSTSKMAE